MENKQETTNRVFCAYSTDKHFLASPVKLECGHYMCKSCVFVKNLSKIYCFICETIQSVERNAGTDSKIEVEDCDINNLVEMLNQRFKESFQQLNDFVTVKREHLEVGVNYARDEIDIKIESMKIELDLLKQKMNDKLDSYLRKFDNRVQKIQKQEYGNVLTASEDSKRTKEDFNTHLQILKNLQTDVEYLKNNFQMKFEINEKALSADSIASLELLFVPGRLNYNQRPWTEDNHGDIPHNSCVLANNTIVHPNATEYRLDIYDFDFKYKRTIKEINGMRIEPYFITSDKRDKVYIYTRNGEIAITDVNFTSIQKFQPTLPTEDFFNDALDFVYHGNTLYVLEVDEDNVQIRLFSPELDFVKTVKLKYCDEDVFKLEVSNDIAMVASSRSACFYRLEGFQLIYKYKIEMSNAFSHNGFFYAFDMIHYHYYCFNNEGKLFDEMYLASIVRIYEHDKCNKRFLFNWKVNVLYVGFENGRRAVVYV